MGEHWCPRHTHNKTTTAAGRLYKIAKRIGYETNNNNMQNYDNTYNMLYISCFSPMSLYMQRAVVCFSL